MALPHSISRSLYYDLPFFISPKLTLLLHSSFLFLSCPPQGVMQINRNLFSLQQNLTNLISNKQVSPVFEYFLPSSFFLSLSSLYFFLTSTPTPTPTPTSTPTSDRTTTFSTARDSTLNCSTPMTKVVQDTPWNIQACLLKKRYVKQRLGIDWTQRVRSLLIDTPLTLSHIISPL